MANGLKEGTKYRSSLDPVIQRRWQYCIQPKSLLEVYRNIIWMYTRSLLIKSFETEIQSRSMIKAQIHSTLTMHMEHGVMTTLAVLCRLSELGAHCLVSMGSAWPMSSPTDWSRSGKSPCLCMAPSPRGKHWLLPFLLNSEAGKWRGQGMAESFPPKSGASSQTPHQNLLWHSPWEGKLHSFTTLDLSMFLTLFC